jgi:murein DD-endopeptidase MepM/ murein hydrolase activator NlpD
MQRFIHNMVQRLPSDDSRRRLILAVLVLSLSLFVVFILNLTSERQTEQKPEKPNPVNLAVTAAAEAVNSGQARARQYTRSLPSAKPFEFAEGDSEGNWTSGENNLIKGEISPGQSLFQSLTARKIPAGPTQRLIDGSRDVFDFTKCRPGDRWLAFVNEDGTVEKFKYQVSRTKLWRATLTKDGEYQAEKIDVPVQTRIDTITGTVNTSLWQTLRSRGERGELTYDFADIFAYSIDFNTETRPGDKFTIVVEKQFLNGDFLDYGTILAAEYINRGHQMRAYYFELSEEESGYYTEKGKNLERQFLKSPLATIRITSRYGQRHHPVLGDTRMHNGVDYGAPVGTNIRAVADGTVVFAGWKGANGRLITLRHANGYITHYAHLHDIDVTPGERVEKKEIIGEVGNTGRSTGPHLHYGMKQYGNYVNPLEVETDRAPPLKGDEKEKFKEKIVPPLRSRLEIATIQRMIDIPLSLKDIPGLQADD